MPAVELTQPREPLGVGLHVPRARVQRAEHPGEHLDRRRVDRGDEPVERGRRLGVHLVLGAVQPLGQRGRARGGSPISASIASTTCRGTLTRPPTTPRSARSRASAAWWATKSASVPVPSHRPVSSATVAGSASTTRARSGSRCSTVLCSAPGGRRRSDGTAAAHRPRRRPPSSWPAGRRGTHATRTAVTTVSGSASVSGPASAFPCSGRTVAGRSPTSVSALWTSRRSVSLDASTSTIRGASLPTCSPVTGAHLSSGSRTSHRTWVMVAATATRSPVRAIPREAPATAQSRRRGGRSDRRQGGRCPRRGRPGARLRRRAARADRRGAGTAAARAAGGAAAARGHPDRARRARPQLARRRPGARRRRPRLRLPARGLRGRPAAFRRGCRTARLPRLVRSLGLATAVVGAPGRRRAGAGVRAGGARPDDDGAGDAAAVLRQHGLLSGRLGRTCLPPAGG